MARDYGMVHREFLSANARTAYRLIVDGERVPDEYADSVAQLVSLGYVVIDAGRGNRPVAMDPQDVADRRRAAMLKENAARIAQLSELPAVTDELSAHFERAQWRSPGGSEYIDDVAVVNARLDDVVGAAVREILTAQPAGPRSRVQLNRSLERDTAALDRGVVKRTLYRATVRDNSVTAKYARAMSGRTVGVCGEFRTLVDPFERCIVVDGEHAFISAHGVEGAPPHAAWYVTDPAAVAYITATFRTAWTRAKPWRGEMQGGNSAAWSVDAVSAPDAGVRTTALQRAILRDTVDGIEQRITAGRLGISLRKLTDEISVVKGKFGANSLTQLAYKFALSPDHLIDDVTPTAVSAA